MGDRANIKSGKIYFYTHWSGSRLPIILKDALIRGQGRWDDEAYLNRIIFSEMIQDKVMEETGYGISTERIGDEYPLITVHPHWNEVVIKGRDGNPSRKWRFEEYIETEDAEILKGYGFDYDEEDED